MSSDIKLSPATLAASGDAAYSWDLNDDSMHWSGALLALFGTHETSKTMRGADFRRHVHDSDQQMFNAMLLQSQGEKLDRDYRVRLHDGSIAWVHEKGEVLLSPQGLPARVQAVLRVITARKLLEMDLASRMRIDPLTGLPNRFHLLERLDPLVAESHHHAADKGVVLAYKVLAIDNMTYVNEAIGPDAADRVILGVLRRIQELVPDVLEIGRVGGDQFGIALRGHADRLNETASALLNSFRDHPVETPACPVHVSISIGGVRAPQSVTSGWEAMIRAEQALRDAQRQGRNVFVEYTPSPERSTAHRKTLEVGQQTLAAFKNNGMRLAFQPIVDAQTGAIRSFEALIRMVNEKGDYIPAGLFIPVIEQLGMANTVDRKVLDMAIAALEADPELVLAVNISGLTASQKGWPDVLRAKIDGRRNISKRLVVEITETAAILDIEETRRFVDVVHEMGGSVALDDFGAGFTSIRYLRTLAANTLKIDRELLSDVVRSTDQQVMVRTLVSLAKGLGLETIAEGVEDEATANWLREAGVDQMQGYYFGKPEVDAPASIKLRYDAKRLEVKRAAQASS